MKRISDAAFDLITRFETGGRAYYNKRLTHPTYPGGSSGVTIGFGYDLGYEKYLMRDWDAYLTPNQLARLARCLGKTGSAARQALSGVRDITISWETAAAVFNDRTLPQEIRTTLETFPGSSDLLPADAFGALISLIFNRGPDMDGDRRREMRAIALAISTARATKSRDTKGLCEQIALQVRAMKRLWIDDPDSDGDLADHREAEYSLIWSARNSPPGVLA